MSAELSAEELTQIRERAELASIRRVDRLTQTEVADSVADCIALLDALGAALTENAQLRAQRFPYDGQVRTDVPVGWAEHPEDWWDHVAKCFSCGPRWERSTSAGGAP